MRKTQIIDGLTERLEQAITDSGMSLSDLCRRSKVSRHMLWQYRYYSVTPSALSLARLAVTLGVTTDWLLGIAGRRKHEAERA